MPRTILPEAALALCEQRVAFKVSYQSVDHINPGKNVPCDRKKGDAPMVIALLAIPFLLPSVFGMLVRVHV